MKQKKLKVLIKEVIKTQAEHAKGYRAAQQNYYDDSILSNFEGYPDDWVTGYKAGLKDARVGKFNDIILKILTSLGELGRNFHVGGWTKFDK